VLEDHGHKVTQVSGLEEGLNQLATKTFDVVVIVCRMPNTYVQQVIEKIRQHAPKVLIVVLSEYIESLGSAEQCTGADVALSKGPHEVQDLLRAIDRLSKQGIPTKPPGSVRTRTQAPKEKDKTG
jgi:CheY-like chemotaxis protein